VGNRCANHVTPLYPQKLALTSPTGGGRSVGIVRSRTKATEFFFNNNNNNNNKPAVVDQYLISASSLWLASCWGRFITYEMILFILWSGGWIYLQSQPGIWRTPIPVMLSGMYFRILGLSDYSPVTLPNKPARFRLASVTINFLRQTSGLYSPHVRFHINSRASGRSFISTLYICM